MQHQLISIKKESYAIEMLIVWGTSDQSSYIRKLFISRPGGDLWPWIEYGDDEADDYWAPFDDTWPDDYIGVNLAIRNIETRFRHEGTPPSYFQFGV